MSDARAEAVEAMAQELDRNRFSMDVLRGMAADALDALLSPRVVPCSECGGDGWKHGKGGLGYVADPETYEAQPCPAGCDHGQVSLPPLAVLIGELEQVGWRRNGRIESIPTPESEPVFRLRSGESSL